MIYMELNLYIHVNYTPKKTPKPAWQKSVKKFSSTPGRGRSRPLAFPKNYLQISATLRLTCPRHAGKAAQKPIFKNHQDAPVRGQNKRLLNSTSLAASCMRPTINQNSVPKRSSAVSGLDETVKV